MSLLSGWGLALVDDHIFILPASQPPIPTFHALLPLSACFRWHTRKDPVCPSAPGCFSSFIHVTVNDETFHFKNWIVSHLCGVVSHKTPCFTICWLTDYRCLGWPYHLATVTGAAIDTLLTLNTPLSSPLGKHVELVFLDHRIILFLVVLLKTTHTAIPNGCTNEHPSAVCKCSLLLASSPRLPFFF